MGEKEPQLNGAYYGHGIPPAEAPRNHRRTNCCSSLFFSFLWKFILAVMIFVVVVFIVFWVVIEPRPFRFVVSHATLAQFNYTSNDNTLRYNLVLNFTARNPNTKLDIYYDTVEANVFYEGVRFATTEVVTLQNSFLQSTKSTDHMYGVFTGIHVTVLNDDQMKDFQEDQRSRIFNVDLKLYFKIRFRLGEFTGSSMKVKAKCELEIPLSAIGNTPMATLFLPTKCHVYL